jgi:hypothetical protein
MDTMGGSTKSIFRVFPISTENFGMIAENRDYLRTIIVFLSEACLPDSLT